MKSPNLSGHSVFLKRSRDEIGQEKLSIEGYPWKKSISGYYHCDPGGPPAFPGPHVRRDHFLFVCQIIPDEVSQKRCLFIIKADCENEGKKARKNGQDFRIS